MEELRSVVFELRPASLEAEELAQVLRKHVDVVRRVSGAPIELQIGARPRSAPRPPDRCSGSPRRRCRTLHHAEAERVKVQLEDSGGRLLLTVADDGRGFDASAPALRRTAARAHLDGGAGDRAERAADRRRAARAGAPRSGYRGPGMIRVLIADDHAVVPQGLRTYLELQEGVEVVAEAADGRAAVREEQSATARRHAARSRDAAARRRRRARHAAGARPVDARGSCSPASARTTACSRRSAAVRRLPAQGHRARRLGPRDPHRARRAGAALRRRDPRGRADRERDPAARRSTSSRRASSRCCG